MQDNIQPKEHLVKVKCGNCGSEHEFMSTRPTLKIDVCSKCHGFFTGSSQARNTLGRAEQFRKKYS